MDNNTKAQWLCQRCGNCCRWPGVVRINDEEINTIADYLNLSEHQFIEQYTELTPDRRNLTLISKQDHSCIFLEGKNHCKINDVKPRQCLGFPNLWTEPNWREKCEAIWGIKK